MCACSQTPRGDEQIEADCQPLPESLRSPIGLFVSLSLCSAQFRSVPCRSRSCYITIQYTPLRLDVMTQRGARANGTIRRKLLRHQNGPSFSIPPSPSSSPLCKQTYALMICPSICMALYLLFSSSLAIYELSGTTVAVNGSNDMSRVHVRGGIDQEASIIGRALSWPSDQCPYPLFVDGVIGCRNDRLNAEQDNFG